VKEMSRGKLGEDTHREGLGEGVRAEAEKKKSLWGDHLDISGKRGGGVGVPLKEDKKKRTPMDRIE